MERREEPDESNPDVAGQQQDDHNEEEGNILGTEDMEQVQQAEDLVAVSVNAEKKRKARFGKLVKLRAYNIFAVKVRPSIKDEFESVTGHEVARIVGQKWVNTPDQDKAQYFEQAQKEHNEMVAKGLIDPAAPQRKPRKSKSDMEAEAAPGEQPIKRKRGRPRKSETLAAQAALAGESGGDGITAQKPDSKPKRQRKRKGEAVAPAAVDMALIGQQVSGVLDGSFDAGYLLTVRVGNSGTVLRGVVFGPGLAVPLSRMNDVTPSVKHVRRDDKIPIPPAAPVGAAPPSTVTSASLAVGSPGLSGMVVLPTVSPPPILPVPVGSQALPTLQPEAQAGYSSVPYSSTQVSYTPETVTVHRHVDVQSGA